MTKEYMILFHPEIVLKSHRDQCLTCRLAAIGVMNIAHGLKDQEVTI